MFAFEHLLTQFAPQIAQFASTVTLLQFFTGVFLLNDIRKKGNTDDFSAIPFLGGVALTFLSLRYGALLRDDAIIKVNFFGFALNIIYLVFYYYYTRGPRKTKIWREIGLTGIFCAVSILYTEYENPELVEFRFGMFLTGLLVLLVGSPLLNLKEVIKTKSTKSLPLPIIVSGTIVSLSWLAYGAAIRNTVFILQNLFLTALCLIQLSMFLIYPREPAVKTKSKKETKVQ